MQEMAQKRLRKGNSSDGFDGVKPGSGIKGFEDIEGFPTLIDPRPGDIQAGQGPNGDGGTPRSSRIPQGSSGRNGLENKQRVSPAVPLEPNAGLPEMLNGPKNLPEGIIGTRIPPSQGVPDGSEVEVISIDGSGLE